MALSGSLTGPIAAANLHRRSAPGASPGSLTPGALRIPANGAPALSLASVSLARGGRRGPAIVTASVSAAPVTEPATKIAFPPTFTPPGLTTPLTLLGTGVREKKIAIISVKVYAVGLYLDVSGGLDGLKGKAGSALFSAVAEAPGDKGIVIALARNITTKQFVEALKEELEPKLKAMGADLAPMAQMGSFFEGRPLTKDSAVVIGWKQPYSMMVSFVDDVKLGYTTQAVPAVVDSQPLLAALFDLYLGAEPISPALLTSISATVPSLE